MYYRERSDEFLWKQIFSWLLILIIFFSIVEFLTGILAYEFIIKIKQNIREEEYIQVLSFFVAFLIHITTKIQYLQSKN